MIWSVGQKGEDSHGADDLDHHRSSKLEPHYSCQGFDEQYCGSPELKKQVDLEVD